MPETPTKPWIEVRGIYGGLPETLMTGERSLEEAGVNAIWLRSDTVTADAIDRVHGDGARIFAEFNSMHAAGYLAENPDAAPIGVDGAPCPPPGGWQGLCPTHAGYRQHRMTQFAELLANFEIDGVWLDYHHAHANWEQAEPEMPDTCFCERCLAHFRQATGIRVDVDARTAAPALLEQHRPEWTRWRCDVFTDWGREYRDIRDRVRPNALLGTFHCPWSDTERDGALLSKLAIDLRAQAEYIDVFSIMPYHARFGHAEDIDWIHRRIVWLSEYLPAKSKRIWPIVQVSDWGENVAPADIAAVIDAATRPPSTGVLVFNWGSFGQQTDKVEALCTEYRKLGG